MSEVLVRARQITLGGVDYATEKTPRMKVRGDAQCPVECGNTLGIPCCIVFDRGEKKPCRYSLWLEG